MGLALYALKFRSTFHVANAMTAQKLTVFGNHPSPSGCIPRRGASVRNKEPKCRLR